MELDEDGLVFHPSLEVGADHGFLTLIEGLINDIYNAAKLIPRLAKGQMSYKVSPGSLAPAAFLTQQCPVSYLLNADGSECEEPPRGVYQVLRTPNRVSLPTPEIPPFFPDWLLLVGLVFIPTWPERARTHFLVFPLFL